MVGITFFLAGILMASIMFIGYVLLRKEQSNSFSLKTPFESGFATTGKVYTVLSLQLLIVLILLLIFDLEVIFVIVCALSGTKGMLVSIWLMVFILSGLWAEWSWGKLMWVL